MGLPALLLDEPCRGSSDPRAAGADIAAPRRPVLRGGSDGRSAERRGGSRRPARREDDMVTGSPTLPESSPSARDDLTLDADDLTRDAVNAFRAAFVVGGALAVILGVVLLFWPVKVAAAIAGVLGIFFIVTGLIRVALGIFVSGSSGGHRILSIIIGILLFVAGVIALRNLPTAGAALLILTVVVIGVGWVIDGVISLVESRKAASRGWAITHGVISIVAGLGRLPPPPRAGGRARPLAPT